MWLFDPAKLGRVSAEAHQDDPASEPTMPATLEAFLASIDVRAFRFAEVALRNRDDALDAVQPSRLRDGYALELVPRRGTLDLPDPRFPLVDEADPEDRARALRDAALGAWREDQWTSRGLPADAGQQAGQDPASLFLARLLIPATRTGVARPERTAAAEVRVDNHTRAFAYDSDALARLLVEL